MRVHANAKLGPAGRLALVVLVEGVRSATAAAESSVSAMAHAGGIAGGRLRSSAAAPWLRSLEPSASPTAASRQSSRRRFARSAPRRVGDPGWLPGLPASRIRQSGRCRARHGLSRLRPPSEARRTATNGRDQATFCTRRLPLRRFRRPGSRHRRSLPTRPTLDGASTRVGYDYAHAIIDDHTRLACRAAPGREGRHGHRVPPARPGLLRHHGITARRLMTDNAFTYVQQPLAARAARSARIRHLTTQPYPPAPRQNRTLPPDHRPRMGPRPQLPLKRAPSQALDRLAQPLQPPATALRDRQPTPISRVHNL